jgi:hypothetical protein
MFTIGKVIGSTPIFSTSEREGRERREIKELKSEGF